MAVRAIRVVPDPVLRAVCDRVVVFDDALAVLVADMFATMYAAPGRGLAAPQIGVSQRVFVMDATWKTGEPAPLAFVNPVIVDVSDVSVTQPEGCLSIPGDLTEVTRPDAVTLRWQDLDGRAHEQRFDGFAAACIQHEVDHLDGILITDPQRGG